MFVPLVLLLSFLLAFSSSSAETKATLEVVKSTTHSAILTNGTALASRVKATGTTQLEMDRACAVVCAEKVSDIFKQTSRCPYRAFGRHFKVILVFSSVP
jgi:predicted Zn-ribbon and HTH transcriptional regulator